ncbi:hypothetical protein PENANT_c006G07557 [Penicillium antarcticum]|uniref:Uncharacterized protein n=1 Tax=Penicillium antarcticum TaxID=416450 RepID=A0A1V6QDL5_9EURO|nr:uncharacterized protein N7508_009321 [Penicillium antarcticum]KAJ5294500.1 hypothetical protein N7508_009321 [Penicillium antarcticum]OQD87300.1 hypothetical protein PENANT_c006G07557 [Penicillium antarcticum]
MAPIRRYLRISKYSVLECRIYLDSPSDSRWLLNSRDPVLPRVFEAIRPLVLPKLREENERLFMRKKGKPVKDVIAEDEFEVAIFLRESRTRHSILTRNKTFHGNDPTKVKPEDGEGIINPGSTEDEIMIESDSEGDGLHDIPGADEVEENAPERKTRKKAGRQTEDVSEEKKLRFNTNYESFNICGWVLCLLITRKGDKTKPSAEPKQPLMEEWISTQAQASIDED